MGIGNTLTAPGMSSGLMGALFSVGASVSLSTSSDVIEEEEAAARGGGVVIMSSKSLARFFTDINSFFSVLVIVVEVFDDL